MQVYNWTWDLLFLAYCSSTTFVIETERQKGHEWRIHCRLYNCFIRTNKRTRCMNVILLQSSHRHVSATLVAIFRVVWTRIQLQSLFVCFWRDSPPWARTSWFTSFLDQTQRRTTVGRTPLDEWSARRRDLYLTTQNSHNRQTSIPPVGFEPTISAGERPQTYALDRATSGTGYNNYNVSKSIDF